MDRILRCGFLLGTIVAFAARLVFASSPSRTHRDALWAPPNIVIDDKDAKPTLPKEMIRGLHVGTTSIIFNETARDSAQKALGGTVGMEGDAGDWEAWLCYHGRNSHGRWILWLLSSELDNDNVSGILWMRLSANESVDSRCKLISGEDAVTLPILLEPGMSESDLRLTLGKPTFASQNIREYLHEHHEIVDHRDFTVTNDIDMIIEDGAVRSIQVWRDSVN